MQSYPCGTSYNNASFYAPSHDQISDRRLATAHRRHHYQYSQQSLDSCGPTAVPFVPIPTTYATFPWLSNPPWSAHQFAVPIRPINCLNTSFVPRSRHNMTAVVDSQSFNTPGMEGAGIMNDYFPSQNQGAEFNDKMWSYGEDDGFVFDNMLQDDAASHIPGSDLQSYSLHNSQFTAPGAAELLSPPNLSSLDTESHTLYQHGQPTPPEDYSSPKEWDSAVSGVPIKQESLHGALETTTRKRPTAEGYALAGSKRRRGGRKSVNVAHTPEEDLDPVEGEKRNRFLERNRVAASKCRQKKKEWTQNLEVEARELQASKTKLSVLVASLKDEVMWLKGEMLKHTDCGCHHIREYLAREAETIASGSKSSFASRSHSTRSHRSSLSLNMDDLSETTDVERSTSLDFDIADDQPEVKQPSQLLSEQTEREEDCAGMQS